MQLIFSGMLGISVLYSLLRGEGPAMTQALLEAAGEAVETAISLAGSFGLFCGFMGILRAAGASERLGRALTPLFRRLYGEGLPPEALDSVALNMTANMLGMGNAATPAGLRAARLMGGQGASASNALCMFLVVNASSVQLIPTTVIALRSAADSADPVAVVWPTLIATLISTLAGIISCKLLEKAL